MPIKLVLKEINLVINAIHRNQQIMKQTNYEGWTGIVRENEHRIYTLRRLKRSLVRQKKLYS